MIPTTFLPSTARTLALTALLAAAPLLRAQPQPATPAPGAAPTPADAAAQPAAAPATPAPPVVGTKVLPAPDRSTPIGGTITGLLDASHAVSAIQRQELPGRDDLFADLNERVATADRQLSELRAKADTSGLNDEGKAGLDKALKEYNDAKAKLQQTMEAGHTADAKQWERTRSTLATDYAFYSAAVAGVEVAVP